MRIVKPSWVSHNGDAIFSVDIHPDRSRFVTSGHDGKVKIWSIAPLLSAEAESDESLPKLLATLPNHMRSVNTARFSPEGLLATASDDETVMIWQEMQSVGNFAMGGSLGNDSIENWRCRHVLRGHSGDVVDLAWSLDSQYLATCSVDTSIIVWATPTATLPTFREVKRLTGHTGHVKGICWDPVGRFLASAGDDRRLLVWRTSDWGIETDIRDPFATSSGSILFRRPSWAPHGDLIVAAHGHNDTIPVAPIVSRNLWDATSNYVGHSEPVIATRFHPSIWRQTREIHSKGKGKGKRSTDAASSTKMRLEAMCALAGKDRRISVWTTLRERPLIVIDEIFKRDVLDLAWSEGSPARLIACSLDGTVVFVEFDMDDLGAAPLTDDERDRTLRQAYGVHATQGAAGSTVAMRLAESPMQLQLEIKAKVAAQRAGASDSLRRQILSQQQQLAASAVAATPQEVAKKQVETRTKDGRRRVAPSNVPLGFAAPVPLHTRMNATAMDFSPDNPIDAPSTSSLNTPPIATTATAGVPRAPTTSSSLADATHMGRLEARLLGRESSSSASGTTTTDNFGGTSTANNTIINVAPSSSPSSGEPLLVNIRRRESSSTPSNSAADKPPPAKRLRLGSSSTPTTTTSTSTTTASSAVFNGDNGTTAITGGRGRQSRSATSASSSQELLAPPATLPELVATLKVPVYTNTASSTELPARSLSEALLKITNADSQGQLECTCERVPQWVLTLNTPVSLLATATSWFVCACLDSTVNVFSSASGVRLLPPLQLASPAAIVVADGDRLMTVCTKGLVNVWNISSVSCELENVLVTPIAACADQSVAVRSATLLVGGNPTVALTTGRSYVYHRALRAWVLVGDATIPRYIADVSSMPMGPVARLQTLAESGCKSADAFVLARESQSANELPQLQRNVALIQSQMAAAQLLRSGSEYRYWLCALGRLLAQCDAHVDMYRIPVHSLCRGLIGRARDRVSNKEDGDQSLAPGEWASHTMGLSKRELLRDFIESMSNSKQCQVVVKEFYDELADLNNHDERDDFDSVL